MLALLTTDNGGIPVVPGGPDGGQITVPGQLQYGDMLTGDGTSAGWRELVGWRDTPAPSVGDDDKPQAHGAYPGSVLGGSAVVTYTFLLRGTAETKQEALRVLELYLPLDGIQRPLVVDEGGGPTVRMARVLQRSLPAMDKAYSHGPLVCSVQFLCSDPLRYDLASASTDLFLIPSVGGLEYPLDYPLEYGTPAGATSRVVTNLGSYPTPPVITFYGELTNPVLASSAGWRLQFDIALGAGEFLTVDTSEGTALLNGDADRLYTIDPASQIPEQCTLPVGDTTLTFSAESGDGTVAVISRPAYL